MPVSKPLQAYLKKAGIKYEVVPHKKVYTAYDLAQTLGAKLDDIAKTLLVKVEIPKVARRGQYYVLVLPATYRANLNKIRKELKAASAELAPEKAMKMLKLQPGAITPFGPFHRLETLIDKGLQRAKKVLVSAGSYTDALRLQVKDLHKMEKVTLGEFGEKAKIKLQKAVKKALAKPAKRRPSRGKPKKAKRK